ncbi:MAG: hypothetical protein RLZZ21_2414, partial [Planctomycetota bacterium]
MNPVCLAIGLLAQATTAAPVAVPTVETPWWREGWAVWMLALATVAVPTFLAWVIAKRFRASDMWGRIAAVLTAAAAGGLITWMGWPPRLGIDLKGGVILVYEVDTSKQSAARIDDAIGRIEQVLAASEPRLGSVTRGAGGRLTVRVDAGDAAARAAGLGRLEALGGEGSDLRLVRRGGTPESPVLDFDVVAAAEAVDMDKLVAAVSRRVNPGGQKEVTVRRYGLDQLEVIVPEVDQAEVDLIKRIVSSAGVLEFRILANPEDPRHRQAIEVAGRAAGTTVNLEGKPAARWVELDTQKMNP